MLHVTYQTGFERAKFRGPALWAFGPEPWRRMESLIQNPTPPDVGARWAYLFGVRRVRLRYPRAPWPATRVLAFATIPIMIAMTYHLMVA